MQGGSSSVRIPLCSTTTRVVLVQSSDPEIGQGIRAPVLEENVISFEVHDGQVSGGFVLAQLSGGGRVLVVLDYSRCEALALGVQVDSGKGRKRYKDEFLKCRWNRKCGSLFVYRSLVVGLQFSAPLQRHRMLVGPLGPERETKHEGRGQMLIVNTPELSKVNMSIYQAITRITSF